jgi:16S rRNA G966 N2-methylase RsmD
LLRHKQYDMFYGMSAKLVELPQKAMRSVAPVFSTALGAVFNTDCLNLFASLNDESIDTVFADPPFNVGKDYGRGKDKDELDDHVYLKWWSVAGAT